MRFQISTYILLWLLISCLNIVPSLAQSDVELDLNQYNLTDALLKIDSVYDANIYFKSEWTDSILVSGKISITDIHQSLTDLLTAYKIHYYKLNNDYYLTGDVVIIDSITFDLQGERTENRFLFEREYASEGNIQLITIGRRSEMITGAKARVVGIIRNESTGETIGQATIYDEITKGSTTSDERGFFSLSLTTGEHVLMVQYAGMKTVRQPILLFSDGSINLSLREEPKLLDEITVVSDMGASIKNVRMGATAINMESLKNVPKVLGENDIVQAALTLPGIQNVGEGSAGFNVRGGKADQNLILLNNATIYNPFHFFGFFSSFNADIMGTSELLKSGIPTGYGGRLSSLLNVKIKKPDKEKFHANLGLNPIITRASVEIPIIKEKTSLLAGGRTTYSDWILNRVQNETFQNSDPFFSDAVLSLDHTYGKGNSINASTYFSTDRFKLSTDSLYRYTNRSISIEWTQLIAPNLTSTFIAGAADYSFDIDYDSDSLTAFRYGFDIAEQFAKIAIDYFPTQNLSLQAGSDAKLYTLNPGRINPIGNSEAISRTLDQERGLERSFFASGEYIISDAISLYGGLRYSFFSPYGGRSINSYETDKPRNSESFIESQFYGEREFIATYHGPEFRFSSKWSLDDHSSIKAGVTQMRQYIHSISNTISVSPTDTWKLSDPNFLPQQSLQYSIGYYKTLKDNEYELSVETYYKTLTNLLDYKVGADLVLNETLERGVLQGIGRAYGIEFLAKKPTGKLNGWVSYTYSRSQQKFDSEYTENRINGGQYFSSNFEKPHDFSLVANYKYTRRYSYSLNVLYSSGRPVTYPTGKYSLGGIEITNFSERNSYRIPDYFRVDASVNIEGSHKRNKAGHGYWSFSIYNVLSRRNAYSIFFVNDNGIIKGYQLSVLGNAIPSLTYNLKL